jgi:hypothetical protein
MEHVISTKTRKRLVSGITNHFIGRWPANAVGTKEHDIDANSARRRIKYFSDGSFD